MISYDPGASQFGLIFQCTGSVFPRAMAWAIPSTVLAVVLHQFVITQDLEMSMSQFASYNFVLGFLVVFRSQQAYSRFWEAATIVQQVRGEWFNAVSSCVAFCTTDPTKQAEVHKFQHVLVRLASLLYCCSLQQIAILDDEAFEVIDLSGFPASSLEYLSMAPEKPLVVLQWMQQLIIQHQNEGIIAAPPPICSRVFQELSRGIVNIVNAQKITDIVLPFPYAQMVSTMLVVQSFLTPIAMATIMQHWWWCMILNFISVFAYWCINCIAVEIEMPFGDDPNDLPVADLQRGMNAALISLVDERCAQCPVFEMTEDTSRCVLTPCPALLVTDLPKTYLPGDHFKERRRTSVTRGTLHGAVQRVTVCSVKSDSKYTLVKPRSELETKLGASLGSGSVHLQMKDEVVKSRITQPEARSLLHFTSESSTESEIQVLAALDSELAKLMTKIDKHFTEVVEKLGQVSQHRLDHEEKGLAHKSQPLGLLSAFDGHMILIVQELDRLLDACAASKPVSTVHDAPDLEATQRIPTHVKKRTQFCTTASSKDTE